MEVSLYFGLHLNCYRPLMHCMLRTIQRLLGLCVLLQHIRQCLRRLSEALVLKTSMSTSSSSIELPPSRRLLKQGSTSMVRCFSTSRFTNLIRATRTIFPHTLTLAANAHLQESLLHVSPHQWMKTKSLMRILMCRVDRSCPSICRGWT